MQKNENPTSRYMYPTLFSDFVHLENIFWNSMKITVFLRGPCCNMWDLSPKRRINWNFPGITCIFDRHSYCPNVNFTTTTVFILPKTKFGIYFFSRKLIYTVRGTRQGSRTRLAIKKLNSRLPQTAVKIDPH